jgi:hypothetical protein
VIEKVIEQVNRVVNCLVSISEVTATAIEHRHTTITDVDSYLHKALAPKKVINHALNLQATLAAGQEVAVISMYDCKCIFSQ